MAAAALQSSAATTSTKGADTVVSVDFQKQLLVDDYVISEKSGVEREQQPAKKENDSRLIPQANELL